MSPLLPGPPLAPIYHAVHALEYMHLQLDANPADHQANRD